MSSNSMVRPKLPARLLGPAARLVRNDPWPVALVVAASIVAMIAWSPITRPMGDSESYRATARVVLDGWQSMTTRTPGYPAVLWLTGSVDHETWLLFMVQLAMHALAVLLTVTIARSMGLPRVARILIAAALVMPAPMVKVVYAGTEATTELLVVLGLWLFVRWFDRAGTSGRRLSTLVWLGAVLGLSAWVRPTFQLLWVPVALAVWWLSRRRVPSGATSRRPMLSGVAVALPAVTMVAVLIVANGVRFSTVGSTPMLGWFLGSRTSGFVEELPESEPLRDLLVAERDRRLLLGPETDAENYMFGISDQISDLTGLSGTALDRRVLELNMGLIVSHPFDYIDAVEDAALAYVQIDAEPAASGPGRLGGWLQSAAHLLLMGAFLVPVVTVPGLILARRVGRRTVVVLAYCCVVAGYVMAISILVETGSPRLRAPTDPLLVLMMVAGWCVVIGVARDSWPVRLHRVRGSGSNGGVT